MSETPNLFAFPAASKAAGVNIEISIDNPIPTALLMEHVGAPHQAALLALAVKNDGLFAWGASPRKNNKKYYGIMKVSDYVICVFGGRCRYIAEVIYKLDNAALAAALWGTTKVDDAQSDVPGAEETWRYIFFLSKPIAIDVPLKDLSGYLPSRFPGFARVGGSNAKNIDHDFGSIAAFVQQKLLENGASNKAPDIEVDTQVSGGHDIAEVFLKPDDVAKALRLLRKKKNLILQGAPGVGKTFVAKYLASAFIGSKNKQQIETVQFHQAYSYEDFIQGFRPVEKQTGFVLQKGIFYRFCERARLTPMQDFVFIIDEINRGNLSKIFGELLMLIESDKRGPQHGIKLAYSDEAAPNFHVPDNVHIIGMMNTADRSLMSIDYALRRRFAFLTVRPAYGQPALHAHLVAKGWSADFAKQIVACLTELNEQIASDEELREGFCIGHSYFCSAVPTGVHEMEFYKEIIETEIEPLLEDYWFDKEPSYVKSAVKKLLQK